MWNALIIRLKLRSTWQLHAMILPAIAMLAVFAYIPMVGIVIAFQKYLPTKGFFGSPWVGMDNFRYLLTLPNVYEVVSNTLVIAVLKIIGTQLFAIIIALLLNEVRVRFFKNMSQSILLFPHFLSWVILGSMFIDVFSVKGIINQAIQWFGVQESIFFLGDPEWFRVFIVSSHIWKEFGYTMIIYMAALTSIDTSLYESAKIDGANRWKQAVHITLPGIAPIIILLATLSLGTVFNAGFEQLFMMYNPLVYSTGDIIDTFVYRIGFESAQYSLATAVGLFKSAIGFALIILSNWMAGRFANYRIF
jgi:putative aldouronate transport system permease protein